jgi:ribosomal protein RSM22 (predicted rRNA methylase)
MDDALERFGFARLKEAAASLSAVYREGRPTQDLRLDPALLAAAYHLTRFPATLAAARRAAQLAAELVGLAPKSLLDLGAGCGAASLALQEIWPSLEEITAIEHLPAMAALGRQLVPNAIWRTTNFGALGTLPAHDVVVFGYSLNEAGATQDEVLARAWSSAEILLLIVEPGTKDAFERILRAREFLLSQGAFLAAPCPSQANCPVAAPDWCHFSVRVQRSSLHRRLKDAELGYEDEKFTFLAASKTPVERREPRILRHPFHEPGRITLELCQAPERQRVTVFKSRDKDSFRRARKAEWGDRFPV